MDRTFSAPQRLYFLDWLRIGAFALLVLYHVGMYYVSWSWHVKSPHAGNLLEPFMRLSSPWRLSLLFLLSGAATSMMMRAGGASGSLLGARTKRLLLPLLFGMAVIVPPQSYFEVVQQHGYAGSYLDFLRLYFTGYGGFCHRAGACLILPTWNHLWFVAYLFVYTAALWLLVRAWLALLERGASALQRALRGAGLFAWPIAALALMRVLLIDRYPPTHALAGDWYLHATYFAVFMAGAALARAPAMWDAMARARWLALALAALGWLALTGVIAWQPDARPHLALVLLARGGFATMQWAAIVAAIGFARVHLDRDHAWRRTLTEAVFPVYILHQTLIVLTAMALRPLQLPFAIEGPLLVAITFAGSWAGYLLVRRVGWLRPWMGLGPAASTPAAAAGPALTPVRGSR
jgi:peptidoglycan/LPS O-acetylase OafA/YrhL